MRTRSLTVVSILIAIVVSVHSAVPSNADHLVAADLNKCRNYRKILVSKLGITPFDCGRAFLMPPFDPEASCSVYRTSKNGQRIYCVTCISVRQNLWQRTDAAHYPARAKNIKAERLDAEIPERTAHLVREVWLRMLQEPSVSRSIASPTRVVLLDTTDAEFSLERSNAAPLYATLNFSLSFPGKKTKQLVGIWNTLFEYCKVPAEKRSEIASRIEWQASQLLAQLK